MGAKQPGSEDRRLGATDLDAELGATDLDAELGATDLGAELINLKPSVPFSLSVSRS